MANQNSTDYIENIRNKILQNLKNLTQPSSAMIPESTPERLSLKEDMFDEEDPELRISTQQNDKRIFSDKEMYDINENKNNKDSNL